MWSRKEKQHAGDRILVKFEDYAFIAQLLNYSSGSGGWNSS